MIRAFSDFPAANTKLFQLLTGHVACRFVARIHGFSFFLSMKYTGSPDFCCELMERRSKAHYSIQTVSSTDNVLKTDQLCFESL